MSRAIASMLGPSGFRCGPGLNPSISSSSRDSMRARGPSGCAAARGRASESQRSSCARRARTTRIRRVVDGVARFLQGRSSGTPQTHSPRMTSGSSGRPRGLRAGAAEIRALLCEACGRRRAVRRSGRTSALRTGGSSADRVAPFLGLRGRMRRRTSALAPSPTRRAPSAPPPSRPARSARFRGRGAQARS